jgi:alpha-mannosidase
MPFDSKIPGKLDAVVRRYTALCFESLQKVPVELAETKEHFRGVPKGQDMDWQRVRAGDSWGSAWTTGWFRGRVRLPAVCHGRRLYLRAATGAPEALLIVDGEHRGVFDPNHVVIMMAAAGNSRRTYEIAIEAHAGHPCIGTQPDEDNSAADFQRTFDCVEVLLQREDVVGFVFDLQSLLQLAGALDESSLRRGRILAALGQVWQAIDAMPAEVPEDSWRPRLSAARRIMQPLLAARNGDTTPFMGIVGHSHIDTAWLWTIAETERKCARTFSSVLNLMEQYPEFRFLQSAPYHADIMRREYPGIFRRIQAAVAAGHWEPNGAMWVEPDCNIPSGEAFVRQLLLGQQFTREHFGYTADAFWQPDVFGYSAALPQILKKAGVDYFLTTKISWNDTTRFPYDTFRWQGIDGTEILSHFNKIHCFPDPKTLIDQWQDMQHKETADRRLSAIGYGDGGGGPQYEMLEFARRVQDLEGCPKSDYVTVTDFMKGIESRMQEPGASLPEWVGELYLELHRGTLTSIAEIKRLNRRGEEALHDAEFLWSLAALSGKRRYPARQLRDLWASFLVNQFHDILPGSSIPEVNDQAIEEMGATVSVVGELAQQALGVLAGTRRKSADAALLIANTLGWPRNGEFQLPAAALPAGHVPSGEGVSSQRITGITGEERIAIQGVNLCALGTTHLPLRKGRAGGLSPFKVGDRTVDTPLLRARFDAAGRITSLLHKDSGRQLVAAGGALNTLWLGEDVPAAWDNWDIDYDQQFKMEAQTRLLSRQVVQGPLQLRIRHEVAIGADSRLTQDVVFHATSAQIDFETVVDWHEKHRLLKAGFDLDVHADTARHEIQFGHVTRPTHSNRPADRAQFEVVNHRWTDLSETRFGVALLNDGKYGISVDGAEARLSLLKSGARPDPRGDEGRHVFTYALLPHTGGFSAERVVRPGYELNVAPRVVPAGGTQSAGSLLTVAAPNVIIDTVKWAEDGSGYILRLYECEGTMAAGHVDFGHDVERVAETNLLEDEVIAELSVRRRRVRCDLRPFELKTLWVTTA